MRYRFPLLFGLLVASATQASAAGLLIPEDKKLPPLAMVNHKVLVAIEDQVAITTLEQTFRNHTDRALEATYLFPIPKGGSVDKFTMWVDGKEQGGELLDAKKANQVYTDIVRRTQDPGLLEYMGNNMMRLRVFPVPPKGDQKIKISFKSISQLEGKVVEYIYPLKTDGKSTATLEEFSVKVSLKSQHPIQNVYSPTHAIGIKRVSDKEYAIEFAKDQAVLDKDFQLFYGFGDQEIGLTPMLYKPVTGEDGYFLMLVSPQVEAEKKRTPRDLVLVLDTSSSMSEIKMQQAKKALKYCLSQLKEEDRFGLMKFSTSVVKFRDGLVAADKDFTSLAAKWVDDLRVSGGTAIWPALEEAMSMKGKDDSRPFTIVFFTDGQPTVDETNPDKILKNVAAKNTASTRIFTFGVGDDVNASMLDQLADSTRAVSTYIRPAEDIETKVASLYGKISNPVLTDLKLNTSAGVTLSEIYPPKLPDLFHGTQLVVIGRYSGNGHSAIKLTGNLASEKKEFVYELNFPAKTDMGAKDFVEPLWARRKVGYLLDQIRANGEQKELITEIVTLAKRYGIATPYTSHLVVPDGVVPVAPGRAGGRAAAPVPFPLPGSGIGGPMGGAGAGFGGGGFGGGIGGMPPGLVPPPGASTSGGVATAKPLPVEGFARSQAKGDGKPGDLASNRGAMAEKQIADAVKELKAESDPARRATLTEGLKKFAEQKSTLDDANRAFKGAKDGFQSGKLGVDLSYASNNLRNQSQLCLTANRQAYGRNCLEIGGVWIDEGFKADTKSVTVKAQGEGYFRILEKQPQMKDVYRLGNHLVWVTPSGTALVIDQENGADKLTDAEIDAMFVAKK